MSALIWNVLHLKSLASRASAQQMLLKEEKIHYICRRGNFGLKGVRGGLKVWVRRNNSLGVARGQWLWVGTDVTKEDGLFSGGIARWVMF